MVSVHSGVMSSPTSFSYTTKPLSLTVHLSSPARSYTLTQLPLLLLSFLLLLLLLYLMLPPWLVTLTKYLTYLTLPASLLYLTYKHLLTPTSPSTRKPVYPSYYEAPGGHKSCISWQVDPAEQERIDRLRGPSHASQLPPSPEQRLAAVLEEDEAAADHPRPSTSAKTVEEHKEREEDAAVRLSAEEKARKAVHYSRVHAELIQTEVTYTSSLRACVDCYILPLQQKCNAGELKLTPADASTLFSNLTAILSFHLLLLSDLQATSPPSIGQVFLKYADYLKMYSAYISNYSASLTLVSRLSSQSAFNRFLTAQRQRPQAHGLDLMSYLIQPIQRIPRYEMLLTQLVRFAPYPSAADGLSQALTKVHAIACLVNERKREAENASLVLEIQHRMRGREVRGGEAGLLQPSRKMVRVGEVRVVGKGRAGGKRLWVLLTDLLVVCKEDYEWKEDVRGRDVVGVEEGEGRGEVALRYKEKEGKGKEVRVVAALPDEEARQSWLISLRQFQQQSQGTK